MTSELRLSIFVILIFVVPVVIFLLPHLWHPAGKIRRSFGPWLHNFPQNNVRWALLRDGCMLGASWSAISAAFVVPREGSVVWLVLAVAAALALYANALDRAISGGRASAAGLLFFAASIPEADIVAFAASHGAVHPIPGSPFTAGFPIRSGYVLIDFVTNTLQTRSDASMDAAHAAVYDKRKQMSQMLGTDLRTGIALAVATTRPLSDTERDVMHIICHFAERWPCILLTADERLLTGEDVCKALEQGTQPLGLTTPKAKQRKRG